MSFHIEAARSIFLAGLEAAAPQRALQRVMRLQKNVLRIVGKTYDLNQVGKLFVIGFGKAGGSMASAVEDLLGSRIDEELILVKAGHQTPLKQGVCLEGAHPVLEEVNLRNTSQLLALLETAQEGDLVLCLISGGGSALLERPAQGLSLEDLRHTTEVLLRAGAPIQDINTIRKHLSEVKGGQLLRHLGGAQVVSLILSDIVGSPLDQIASGPTVADPTIFQDALGVVDRLSLRDQLPAAVVGHLVNGSLGLVPETPKPGDVRWDRVQNVVVADNAQACDAAELRARALGYRTILWSTQLQGEVRTLAREWAQLARTTVHHHQGRPGPTCILAGGEPTVTVTGTGLGGRNQELALAVALELQDSLDYVFLSAGTDGTDGPTDAAGAIADTGTLFRAQALGLDAGAFLANNDSHRFFRLLDDLVVTGPTLTNVNDLMVLIIVP